MNTNSTTNDDEPTEEFEETRWSPGLIGFYAGCAGVSIGAAVAATGYLVFESNPQFIIGVVVVAISAVVCMVSLHAARKT